MKKVLITMRYDINQYGKLIDIFERDYSSLFSNYPIQLIILPNVWDSMEYWINVGFDPLSHVQKVFHGNGVDLILAYGILIHIEKENWFGGRGGEEQRLTIILPAQFP